MILIVLKHSNEKKNPSGVPLEETEKIKQYLFNADYILASYKQLSNHATIQSLS